MGSYFRLTLELAFEVCPNTYGIVNQASLDISAPKDCLTAIHILKYRIKLHHFVVIQIIM